MVFALCANIEFPKSNVRKAFDMQRINGFKVVSGWKNLTDTAEVYLAKKFYLSAHGKVKDLFKVGNEIVIIGGANGEYFEEFRGYIARIKDDVPVVLMCEDAMWLMKTTKVNKSYSSVKLAALLKDIVPAEFKIDAYDVYLGEVLLENTTVAKTLQMLKDTYSIYCYFKGKTLYAGKVYSTNPEQKEIELTLDKTTKQKNLTYAAKEDFKIRVDIKSQVTDGKDLKVSVGEDGGDVAQLIVRNITNKAELTKLANLELNRLSYDGYRGTVTTYVLPFAKHGYKVKVIDENHTERSGRFYLDEIVTTLSEGGYERVLTLGPKANDK